MNSLRRQLPVVDAVKALASQIIVWHHMACYGPMSDVAYPLAPAVLDWLYDYGLFAVQAFLVVGGFLAARSLAPRLDATRIAVATAAVPQQLWRRYVRLMRPYAVALAAAIALAWLARVLVVHPTTPPAPTLAQLFAHVFLLQDVLGMEGLSAGVWYLAIDFQLYALLLLTLWVARRLAALGGGDAGRAALILCGALTGASLFWLNRNPALDAWAPYFFGAYGLGILAQWLSTQPRQAGWGAALTLVVLAALAIEWRERILVAGLTALLLTWRGDGAPQWMRSATIAFLARISFPVFLLHYPVYLAVGAVVFKFWPDDPTIHAIGMVATWLLSLGAGTLLYRAVEQPALRRSDAPPMTRPSTVHDVAG
ncbi:MAG: acyltransferase [Rhodocyclales bacterium]|nr:acyltransferase [Rhodocyclales bacterium]